MLLKDRLIIDRLEFNYVCLEREVTLLVSLKERIFRWNLSQLMSKDPTFMNPWDRKPSFEEEKKWQQTFSQIVFHIYIYFYIYIYIYLHSNFSSLHKKTFSLTKTSFLILWYLSKVNIFDSNFFQSNEIGNWNCGLDKSNESC